MLSSYQKFDVVSYYLLNFCDGGSVTEAIKCEGDFCNFIAIHLVGAKPLILVFNKHKFPLYYSGGCYLLSSIFYLYAPLF